MCTGNEMERERHEHDIKIRKMINDHEKEMLQIRFQQDLEIIKLQNELAKERKNEV